MHRIYKMLTMFVCNRYEEKYFIRMSTTKKEKVPRVACFVEKTI